MSENYNDGIYGMVPRERMTKNVKKLRDIYEMKPGAPIFQREFGHYSLEAWAVQGKLDGKPHDAWTPDEYLSNLFKFDEPAAHSLKKLGWSEAEFYPVFEDKVIEDRGDYELVQDFSGRSVLFFKGRRDGFMPEYVDHPVKDMKSWEEKCKWRMDPKTFGRFAEIEQEMKIAKEKASQGYIITQRMIGGYMYLRSIMGPVELMYLMNDDPLLVHDCMKTWFELADAVIAEHQKHVTLDEFFFGEDICYNHGLLISPTMIKDFLFPYYQQLITNMKSRQLDKKRHLYIQLDSDGSVDDALQLYKGIGIDSASPFEVASGSDVVVLGEKYPDLIMSGGIDKRILAEGKDAIDRHLDYILPAMSKRGGYTPTCDHGVPAEVSFENYMHYRKRCLEYS